MSNFVLSIMVRLSFHSLIWLGLVSASLSSKLVELCSKLVELCSKLVELCSKLVELCSKLVELCQPFTLVLFYVIFRETSCSRS